MITYSSPLATSFAYIYLDTSTRIFLSGKCGRFRFESTMRYASYLLQRFIYPLIIAGCILARPVLLSNTYLVLFFWLPFVPVAQPPVLQRHLKIYLFVSIFISAAICSMHCIFQLTQSLTMMANQLHCAKSHLFYMHIGFMSIGNFLYVLFCSLRHVMLFFICLFESLQVNRCVLVSARRCYAGHQRHHVHRFESADPEL